MLPLISSLIKQFLVYILVSQSKLFLPVTEVEEDTKEEQLSPMERIRAEIADLEEKRSRSLFDRHVIGKVSSWKGDVTYNINIRRVNFKWQRGNKIGGWNGVKSPGSGETIIIWTFIWRHLQPKLLKDTLRVRSLEMCYLKRVSQVGWMG